ncbi:T-cell receptor alpha chain [Podarcis lilfordi]|nr:T-cell receptor alpha chain [Podarcis lilfordi]
MISTPACLVFLAIILSNPAWAQEVIQPGLATALDRKPYNLSCSLSSASSDMIQWYRQFPGEGLQYIAGGYPGIPGEGADPKSTVYVGQDKKSNTLVLHQVKLADAAVYYCALSDTVCQQGTFPVQKLFSVSEQRRS